MREREKSRLTSKFGLSNKNGLVINLTRGDWVEEGGEGFYRDTKSVLGMLSLQCLLDFQ